MEGGANNMWHTYFDERYQAYYKWNTETGESHWLQGQDATMPPSLLLRSASFEPQEVIRTFQHQTNHQSWTGTILRMEPEELSDLLAIPRQQYKSLPRQTHFNKRVDSLTTLRNTGIKEPVDIEPPLLSYYARLPPGTKRVSYTSKNHMDACGELPTPRGHCSRSAYPVLQTHLLSAVDPLKPVRNEHESNPELIQRRVDHVDAPPRSLVEDQGTSCMASSTIHDAGVKGKKKKQKQRNWWFNFKKHSSHNAGAYENCKAFRVLWWEISVKIRSKCN